MSKIATKYNNQPIMSSKMLLHQNFNPLQQVEIDREKGDRLKILHWPADKVSQILKTEVEILATFKESLNLQHESFDFKCNTFKQLIEEFRIKSDQDQAEILEIYGVDDDVHVKPSKQKAQAMPQGRSDKSENNSLFGSQIDDSLGAFQGAKHEKTMIKEKKPKLPNKTQIQQEKVREQPIGQLIERRIKKPVKYQQSDNLSESQPQQQKPSHAKKAIKQRGQSQNFYIETRGPNKYEIARQRLQQVIENQGKIENHYNKIGEILLHPYSTLQMLLDYNESSDYPLVKVRKNERVSEVSEEEESD